MTFFSSHRLHLGRIGTYNDGYRLLLPLLLSALVVGCLPATHSTTDSSVGAGTPLSVTRGKASYYADKFEGRRTASGEVFRQSERTAAHPNYPFGTVVRVVNLSNGRTVVVRVNDRLPGSSGRAIDLSRQAAEDLAMIREGVVDVRLEVLQWGT